MAAKSEQEQSRVEQEVGSLMDNLRKAVEALANIQSTDNPTQSAIDETRQVISHLNGLVDSFTAIIQQDEKRGSKLVAMIGAISAQVVGVLDEHLHNLEILALEPEDRVFIEQDLETAVENAIQKLWEDVDPDDKKYYNGIEHFIEFNSIEGIVKRFFSIISSARTPKLEEARDLLRARMMLSTADNLLPPAVTPEFIRDILTNTDEETSFKGYLSVHGHQALVLALENLLKESDARNKAENQE